MRVSTVPDRASRARGAPSPPAVNMLLPIVLLFSACAPPPWSPDTSSTTGACDSATTAETADTSETADTAETAETGDTAPPDPAVSFKWPAQESTQSACAMFVFDVGDFQLTDFRVEPEAAVNQGHLHIYWEDQYTTCVTPYCLVEFGAVEEANYTVTVKLANNDHSDYLDSQGEPIIATRDLHIVPGTCLASVEGLQ